MEGDAVVLLENGQTHVKKLKLYDITDKALAAALHKQSINSFTKVKATWLEPDGKLSVIKKDKHFLPAGRNLQGTAKINL